MSSHDATGAPQPLAPVLAPVFFRTAQSLRTPNHLKIIDLRQARILRLRPGEPPAPPDTPGRV